MDYKIRRKKSELDSTGYIEIGPGKYSGKHWQDGFLFILEDAFGMAEGILQKHYLDYDHFGMNDIPFEVGNLIISEWRSAANYLSSCSLTDAQEVFNLNAVYSSFQGKEIEENRVEIAEMLIELSNNCEEFFKENSWICVLGI